MVSHPANQTNETLAVKRIAIKQFKEIIVRHQLLFEIMTDLISSYFTYRIGVPPF